MSESAVKKIMLKVEVPKVFLSSQTLASSCKLCHVPMTNMGAVACVDHVIGVHLPALFNRIDLKKLTRKSDCCRKTTNPREFANHFTIHHGIIFFLTDGPLSFMMQSVPIDPNITNPTPEQRKVVYKCLSKEMMGKIMVQVEYQAFFTEQKDILGGLQETLQRYYQTLKDDVSKYQELIKRASSELNPKTLQNSESIMIHETESYLTTIKEKYKIQMVKAKLLSYNIENVEKCLKGCVSTLSDFQSGPDKKTNNGERLKSLKFDVVNTVNQTKRYVKYKFDIERQIDLGNRIVVYEESGRVFQINLTSHYLDCPKQDEGKATSGKKKEELEQDPENDNANETHEPRPSTSRNCQQSIQHQDPVPTTSSGIANQILPSNQDIIAPRALSKNEENIMKTIQDLTKEIDGMRRNVVKDQDIESYVLFLRKNLQKAYKIWALAEMTMKKQYFQEFVNFATQVVNFGPNNRSLAVLYKNELIGSKCILYYVIMAYVHLGEIKQAFQGLKFWLRYGEDEGKFKEEIRNLTSGHCWLMISNQDPKEDVLRSEEIMNNLRIGGSFTQHLMACLVAIKIEVIIAMKQRLNDRKDLYKALEKNMTEMLAKLKKKYPCLEDAKLFEADQVILEGFDLKSYKIELTNQMWLLKKYIKMCSGTTPDDKLHPTFVATILDSNNEAVTKIHEYHLSKEVYSQSSEHASLGSCLSYFAKVGMEKKNVQEIITEALKACDLDGNKIDFPPKINKRKRSASITSTSDANQDNTSGETISKKPAILSTMQDFAFDSENNK